MCGRYALYLPPALLKERLGLANLLDIKRRYNCAPIQNLPIVIKNRAGFARWGFRPEWAESDDPAMAAKMINARSETVAEKPAFKGSWAAARRCLVPVSGFYEWSRDEHTKVNQPYYITSKGSDLLLLAGLWSKVGEMVSFTVLTKQVDENLKGLHHRSPVMIGEDNAQSWFEGGASVAADLVAQSTTRILQFHTVGKEVGSIANDHEGLIAEVSPEKTDLFG